jgi:hypothetical protein
MNAPLSVGDFWRFMLLRTEAFDGLRRSPGSLRLSLQLFLLAGLIGSIGILAGGLADAGQLATSDRFSAAAASVESTAAGWPSRFTPRLASAMTAIADRLEGAAAAVRSVEPPFGVQTSRTLRAIGIWFSQAFLSLTAWLTALLPLLLVTRLAGGPGSLRQQVSLILLAFLPQALVFPASFGLEPDSTAAMALTAVRLGACLWSLLILVTALTVANGFTRGKAVKTLVATALAVLAVAILLSFLADRLAGPLLSLLL